MSDTLDLCTLATLVIDDIYPADSEPDQAPKLSVLGGSGTFCSVGARILSPPPLSRKVGWVVDCGGDFSDDTHKIIQAWDIETSMRRRSTPTTRARVGYSKGEVRSTFELLTPSVPIDSEDLPDEMLRAKSFHLFGTLEKQTQNIRGVLHRRKDLGATLSDPIVIYEPRPADAVPAQWHNIIKAMDLVQIFSPNHTELASMCGRVEDLGVDGFNAKVVEECVERLLGAVHPSKSGLSIVIRSGANGCYIRNVHVRQWLPAYYDPYHQNRVIDSTGAGNAFLGAMAVGLVRTGDIVEACIWASVAASFLVEQVGLPRLVTITEADDTPRESWNGVDAKQRLEEFRTRCTSILDSERPT